MNRAKSTVNLKRLDVDHSLRLSINLICASSLSLSHRFIFVQVKVMLGFTNNEEQISNMVESVRPEMPDSNFAGDSDREKNNDDEGSGNINLGAVLFSLSNLLKLPIPSEFRSTQNSLAENSEDCEGITMKFPNDITSNSVRISSSGCIVRCILIYGRSKEVSELHCLLPSDHFCHMPSVLL